MASSELHTLTYANGEVVELEYKEWDGSHGYWVKSPSKYAGRKQGVTTCQGVLDKPGLKQWAANMVCDSIRENCTQDPTGYFVTEDDLKVAKYAHKNYTSERADVGSRCHDWWDAQYKGRPYKVDTDMQLGVNNIQKFEDKYNPKYLFSERIMYSIEHDYAGKCDRGVELGGKYGLIDLKTGKPDEEYKQVKLPSGRSFWEATGRWRARGEHFSQNAGYDIGFTELDGRKAEFYGVLYVDALDGRWWYFQTDNTEFYRQDFLTTLKKFRQVKERDSKINLYQ